MKLIYFEYLLGLVKSSRQNLASLGAVSAATIVNSAIAFFVNIFVAKKLSAEGYGVFSLAFSIASITEVMGNFGLSLATIRMFNKYKIDPEKQNLLFAVVLTFNILFFILLGLIAMPFGRLLSDGFSVDAQHSFLFSISLFTGGFLLFWIFFQTYLQAKQNFRLLTMCIFLYAILRVVFLLIFWVLPSGGPIIWFLATYTFPVCILVLILVVPLGYNLLPRIFRKHNCGLEIFKETINYSKWVALSGVSYMALPHAVRFALARKASLEEVGIFSAGMMFTMVFSTINTSIRTVFFPKVTALESREDMIEYLKKLKHIAPAFLLISTIGIVSFGFFQYFMLGKKYIASLPVFLISATSFSIVLFLSFGTMLIHAMMKPEVEGLVEVSRLILVFLFSYFLARNGAIIVTFVYAIVLLGGTIIKYIIMRRWLHG